jgi:putative ABC transport system substrate-binding protein
MDRRGLIAFAGVAAAWPLGVLAQGARLPVLGILTPHRSHAGWPAFFETLRRLGYEDGRTLKIVTRSAEGKLERLPGLAAELVAIRPDLILAINTPGSRAAAAATKDLPVLLADIGDPVGEKLVASLARPGGNVTAISNQGAEFASKRLAVMKALVPAARRIALILHPDDPVTRPQRLDAERAAPALAIEIGYFEARGVADLDPAFERMAVWKADAALWLAGQTAPMQPRSAELAAAHRLPTMLIGRDFVVAGGLISYWIDQHEVFRRAAHYVDKILKGAKPADLPVEQPTKFELVVNLKTAKALGLIVPTDILLQADEVIE